MMNMLFETCAIPEYLENMISVIDSHINILINFNEQEAIVEQSDRLS